MFRFLRISFRGYFVVSQIAKRRSKVPSTKSPGVHLAKPAQRPMKHLSLLPFSCIKRILDINETAGGSCFCQSEETKIIMLLGDKMLC